MFTSVLRECKNVELSFSDVACKTDLLKGTKKGTVYLTPYRVNTSITFIFNWQNISAAVVCGKLPQWFSTSCCNSPHSPLFSIVIHWHSWCLCPVTPRTAWVQLCSPIIWWKAAALSSQSLQPTTLKGQCQLRLVVSDFCLCCFVVTLYH